MKLFSFTQCLLQKDNQIHLSLFSLIWSVETSYVLQVWRAVEENLKSEKKPSQTYFYQAYFSSPQELEWSPSDGRKGKEGVKLHRGEIKDLCMESTVKLSILIHVQGDEYRHFSMPKLENHSYYLYFHFFSFFFSPCGTRGKIMIRAVRQAYNILKEKMTHFFH